jgi:hypothetical protein
MSARGPRAAESGRRGRVRGVLLASASVLVALPFVAWGSLALALDGPGRVLAVAYSLASLALLVFVRPRRRGWFSCAGLFVLVLAWWLLIEPRNDRNWLPDVNQLSTVQLEGERLTVANLRNFKYRTESDFTPHWEERTYDLARLTGMDLLVCDWGEALIVHTMMSWEFEGGEHLVVSIETRKEVGEGYSALRGFFRQFELYYVVGDERDLIGVRVGVRGERVRLYRLAVSPEQARALLLGYAQRINRLVEEPAWYNALTHNCTTSIRLHAVELGIERPWNWRILVNGYGEELLYMRAMVDTSLSFEELRTRSDITGAARAAGTAPDFSQLIRAGIPARPR